MGRGAGGVKMVARGGLARSLETTTRIFAEMARRGALTVPDPAIAAELFLGAIRNDLYLRRFIGLPPASGEPEADAIERRVSEAACAFAHVYWRPD